MFLNGAKHYLTVLNIENNVCAKNNKLYVFDLDGTIIDSEYSHYEAYNLQLTNKISFEEYENIFHDETNKNKFIEKLNNE